MSSGYDVIVIGARCGGSPTAMLLARKGYRVLLVDKVTFPSDTISTHMIHPPGVAALKRWGLLERLEATGCPRSRITRSISGRSRSPGPHGQWRASRRGSAPGGSC
jgi:2-polyprenyl-6-methoxyphenol hydroxylase-like FAD-dependent oxidoreductase